MEPLAPFVRRWNNVDQTESFKGPFLSENLTDSRSSYATIFEQWQGRYGVSGLADMKPNEIPALQHALELSELDSGQASDALTFSNIAILALPMALSMVPVALVTDVSSRMLQHKHSWDSSLLFASNLHIPPS